MTFGLSVKCHSYALKTLRCHGLDDHALWGVTQATLVAQLLYASPFWRGFINAEETNRLQSILTKTIRRSYLPLGFNSLDELMDSADHALFRVIVRIPSSCAPPTIYILPPRKKTVYNLRKLTHGLTIPPVCSNLMRKNFLIRVLYTDIY